VGFDVIQSCNPPDIFWTIGKYWKRRKKAFVFDHHDLCPELFVSRFKKETGQLLKSQYWLERKTFETADMVISTNESYKEIAVSRGKMHPDDVAVVRSGPQLARFKPTEPDPSLKRGRPYLGVYLGVMGPQDGVDIAVRAVDVLVKKYKYNNISFTFVGGGDCLEDLKTLVCSLGLEDYIQFTGRIPDEDLMRYLSSGDLGIAPDPYNPLNNVSTMNKMIEYMAMGLPIVSFDLKESKYSAGEAAVYVQPNDEDLFAKAIMELAEDETRRKQMGELGRKRVEEQLAWDHSRKVLVAAYDRLFEKMRTGRK
jgi:glycosyltransferase involved in cell wall biosynthesis